MSAQQAESRLHPGVIASVIFVLVAAVAAAVLIIRKYCFPVNETVYRYSLLRHMEEEQQSAVTGEDGDRGVVAGEEESDEDLLE